MDSALFSLSGVSKLQENEKEAVTLLKGAALLYSKIVTFSTKEGNDEIIGVISNGITKKNRKAAAKLLKPITKLDSKWNNTVYNWDLLKELDNWTKKNNKVLDKNFEKLLSDWMEKDSQAGSQHIFLALLISITKNLNYHDSVSNIKNMIAKPITSDTEITVHTELAVTLPSLETLTWDDIFELRDSPYITGFRKFIHQNNGKTPEDILSQVTQALWDVVGKNKPSKGGDVVQRGLGQIPLPFSIPNPISVYRDVKEGIQERKLYVNYGWVFFMQEAKEKSTREATE